MQPGDRVRRRRFDDAGEAQIYTRMTGELCSLRSLLGFTRFQQSAVKQICCIETSDCFINIRCDIQVLVN